jgi:hypothetical protein
MGRVDWHEKRRIELQELRRTDPSRLLSLYRRALALDELAPLPDDISFEMVIESVILSESCKRSSGTHTT